MNFSLVNNVSHVPPRETDEKKACLSFSTVSCYKSEGSTSVPASCNRSLSFLCSFSMHTATPADLHLLSVGEQQLQQSL